MQQLRVRNATQRGEVSEVGHRGVQPAWGGRECSAARASKGGVCFTSERNNTNTNQTLAHRYASISSRTKAVREREAAQIQRSCGEAEQQDIAHSHERTMAE